MVVEQFDSAPRNYLFNSLIFTIMKKIIIDDKASEIAVLEALCANDTYFAQFFQKDLAQMTSNISNDWSIEANCSFQKAENDLGDALAMIEVKDFNLHIHSERISHLENVIETMQKTIDARNERITDLCTWALKLQNWDRPVNASEQFNFFERLAAKLQAGMSLDVDEASYLLGKIEKP
jgi:hypothetical protein